MKKKLKIKPILFSKSRKELFCIVGISFFAFAFLGFNPAPAFSQDADQSQFFMKTCSGCHTIGGGKLVGPDLIAQAANSEAETHALVSTMKKFVPSLTPEQINSMTKYLQSKNSSQNLKVSKKKATEAAASGDAQRGKALFTGASSLTNGGISCISCHSTKKLPSLSGGRLGPLLDKKIGGDVVQVMAEIKSTGWKVMGKVYKDHPVTDSEATDLATFLISPSESERSGDGRVYFVTGGLAGALIVLLALAFIYRNRLTKKQ